MTKSNEKSKFIVVGLTIGFLLLTGGIIGIAFTANVYVVIAMAIIIAIGAIIGIATLVIGMNTQPESSTEITKEKNIELSEPEKKMKKISDVKEKMGKLSDALNAAGKNLEVQEINSESRFKHKMNEIDKDFEERQKRIKENFGAMRKSDQELKDKMKSAERERREAKEKSKQEQKKRDAEFERRMEELQNNAKRNKKDFEGRVNATQKKYHEEKERGRQILEEVKRQKEEGNAKCRESTERAQREHRERVERENRMWEARTIEIKERLEKEKIEDQEEEKRIIEREEREAGGKQARLDGIEAFWNMYIYLRRSITETFSQASTRAIAKLCALDNAAELKRCGNKWRHQAPAPPVNDAQRLKVEEVQRMRLKPIPADIILSIDDNLERIDPVTGVSTELINTWIEGAAREERERETVLYSSE